VLRRTSSLVGFRPALVAGEMKILGCRWSTRVLGVCLDYNLDSCLAEYFVCGGVGAQVSTKCPHFCWLSLLESLGLGVIAPCGIISVSPTIPRSIIFVPRAVCHVICCVDVCVRMLACVVARVFMRWRQDCEYATAHRKSSVGSECLIKCVNSITCGSIYCGERSRLTYPSRT